MSSPDSSFIPLHPASASPNAASLGLPTLWIRDAFRLSTLLLLGAGLQTLLFAALPRKLALVPLAVAAVGSVASTIREAAAVAADSRLSQGGEGGKGGEGGEGGEGGVGRVLRGRSTAQLVHADGSFGNRPSVRPVVAFHIGVQVNHPLGIFAPGVSEVRERFGTMHEALSARRRDYGMLGGSGWIGNERARNNTLLWIYYFDDLDGLSRFAQAPLHRGAIDWVAATLRPLHPHIGIFHETFCAPGGSWETVYVNCRPQLLGASQTAVAVGDGDVVRWQSPLVVADHPRLTSQRARLGGFFTRTGNRWIVYGR